MSLIPPLAKDEGVGQGIRSRLLDSFAASISAMGRKTAAAANILSGQEFPRNFDGPTTQQGKQKYVYIKSLDGVVHKLKYLMCYVPGLIELSHKLSISCRR